MSLSRVVQVAAAAPLFAILMSAQALEPAEAELRERVQTFYQLQMDKKFRQAEAFVAEDTKDFYYNSAKGTFNSFKIADVKIVEPGKMAKVTVRSSFTVMMMGAARPMPMEMPVTSTWKMEEGKWVMFVDQTAPVPTPFGDFKRGAPDAGGGFPKMPSIPNLTKLVQADKTLVTLTAEEPVQTVTLTNNLPGAVDFKVDATGVPRVAVEAENTKIGANGTAKIVFRRKLDGVTGGNVHIEIGQIGTAIDIQVVVR